MPDTADRLARTLLSVMALGRGGQMADLSAFVDKTHHTVVILRPLRDICEKEVALVNRMEKCDRYTVRYSIVLEPLNYRA